MFDFTFFQILISVIGVIIAVAQILVAILNYRRNSLEAQWKFWNEECSAEQTQARATVDKHIKKDEVFSMDMLDNDDLILSIKMLCNQYQNLGSLVSEKHLSKKRLRNMPIGRSVIKYYTKLKPWIEYYRKPENYDNSFYAIKFEWLYKKLSK